MHRLFSYMAIVTLLLASIVAESAFAKPEMPTVRIQDYPGMVSVLPRVMVEKGYCEDHGIHCKLVTLKSAPLGIQTLAAGDIEVAASSVNVAISAGIKKMGVKAVGSGNDSNPFMLIFGKTLKDKASLGYPAVIQALKGKTVGVTARGAAPEFQLRSMLYSAGVSPDDVTFVAVGAPSTAYPALVSGRVDAVMSFVPFGAICDVLHTCSVALKPIAGQAPEVFTNPPAGLYLMRRSYTEKHPEIEKAFKLALGDAARFGTDPNNFEEMYNIQKKYFGIKLPHANKILRIALKYWLPTMSGTVDKKRLQAVANQMYKTKQVTTKFDVNELF